jgi:hypothetical protein
MALPAIPFRIPHGMQAARWGAWEREKHADFVSVHVNNQF